MRTRRFGIVLVAVTLLSAAILTAYAADASRRTVAFDVRGERYEGMPLIWSGREIAVLARDGRLLTFQPSEIKNARQVSSSFQSDAASEMRVELTREFGQGFEVSGTGHFVVVYPRGQREYWSSRFEELYRSFVHYFMVRGVKVREPEFPLVAIVFKNKEDYQRYYTKDGVNLGSNTLGYYSGKSNRIALFDAGGGSASADNWQQNSSVIIHEATHQTAFNTGVHRRFSGTPRWLTEGLAMMFEAPGVWNSRTYIDFKDRINHGRLSDFQQLAKLGKTVDLADMIASDRIFDTDPISAYATAWAFTFFLVEQQPREYAAFLQRTADKKEFANYSAAERTADFVSIFGNFAQVKARFDRFMADLK